MNLRQLKKLRKKENNLRKKILKIETAEEKELAHIKTHLSILKDDLKKTQQEISLLETIIKERKEKNTFYKFWTFLNEDTWQSTFVSLILIVLFIKLIFFPVLSLLTGSPLPLVVVESCSMYHKSTFDNWWEKNSYWYDSHEITKSEFEKFSFKNGLNKGDIILVLGTQKPKLGSIIIFEAGDGSIAKYPIIHRVVSTSPLATKGDNNPTQLTTQTSQKIDETNISQDKIVGKAVIKIPLAGWVKLIFFEPFRPASERGFCKENSVLKPL